MPSDSKDKSDFEREKWLADVRLRERELAIMESEAAAKNEELKRSRWRDPIVLAVLAAALAASGNAVVAVINGNLQRGADERHAQADNQLQAEKSSGERQIEEGKAEAARILEVLKTNDPDKAATNLAFLLQTGLIVAEDRRKSLAAYLKNREAGQGPALPSTSTALPTAQVWSPGFFCSPKDPRNIDATNAEVELVRQRIRDDLTATVAGIRVSRVESAIHVEFDYQKGTPPSAPWLSDIDVQYVNFAGVPPKIFVGNLMAVGHVRAQVNASVINTLNDLFADRPCVAAPG